MKDEEKSRPTILVDTEDKLEAFFNKDEFRLIEDVVDDALGFRDDYENIMYIKVCSSNIIDDRVRIIIGQRIIGQRIIGQRISSISTVHEPIVLAMYTDWTAVSYKVCCYNIPVTEKLFKSIDRDFIFLIKPKLLTIDAIERKEV